MGTPKEPKPAKYFVALLSPEIDLLSAVEKDLSVVLGNVDVRSETLSWTASKFYENEMGVGLLRRFLSFERLMSPEKLADIKLATQGVEERYRRVYSAGGGRRVNLDPGYLEAGKVVLASTKNASQRIFLRGGVFAEATLLYYGGEFHACAYTYLDYQWPETLRFLKICRDCYLEQLRQID
ncbi:MAG: DUF4416 family protein [Deltaproteobacteria bacterium]|nr:DUF4416 family protein [Deltaproteobacteria bacterium]